ncbi:MAG: aminotransferase class V-fold PLP-dependent enzyme [Gammaproteobacteria bacterium]|nr:aminotransferase class V-fold PLP-dependent enzyme [Gammaproteobacteria bacterium]
MDDLNIEKLRNDTPGCKNVVHFNNAGAALPPLSVTNAIKEHLDLESSIGGYEAAQAALDKSEKIYDYAAQLINCDREEIAFLENATRAWEMAFCSLKFNKGDRILTAMSEYASNYLAFLHCSKRTGVIIDVVKNDSFGQLDLEDLRFKINDRVKLIAITHIPTQGGLINPAEEVGKIARENNILYLLDTTQSVGQMPVDVKKIGCDFLCATGRKYLRGPRGTGFLYASKKILDQCDPPFVDLHSATWIKDNDYILNPTAHRFETWEQNIAAKIGLGVAIEYALNLDLSKIWDRIQLLSNLFRQQLSSIQNIELHDLGVNKCGIVTFTCKGKKVDDIQQALSKRKINVSISLQEYARLDMSARHLPAVVRASVHYYNTEEEVNLFCEAIKSISEAK